MTQKQALIKARQMWGSTARVEKRPRIKRDEVTKKLVKGEGFTFTVGRVFEARALGIALFHVQGQGETWEAAFENSITKWQKKAEVTQ